MQLLIATGNKGKIREIAHVLERAGLDGISPISLHELSPIAEPIEDQPKFSGNAIKKALHYATATGLMCLADDSGLCVDVLDGAPGVLSARYAGEPCNDLANNRKLVAALTGIALERRTAKFVCSLALATQRTVLALITDQIGGLIIDEPRGSGGFGYDPHFLLPELGKTTAELSMEHKSQLSHRGKATRRMVEWIKSYQKIITSMPYRMIDSTERA